MTRQQWRQRTSWDEVCARQAGRRKYNESRRRYVGQVCDEVILPLLLKYGFDRWGTLTRVAEELGISKATTCRYRQRIVRGMLGQ
jgi:hypothetical protein